MAEAYAGSSYKYQYSVPVAQHGADVAAYFGPATPNQGPDFQLAFRSMQARFIPSYIYSFVPFSAVTDFRMCLGIWGNFITTNNPSISAQIANGASSNASSSGASNPASDWPPFAMYAPYQINMNETGGTPFSTQAVGSTGSYLFALLVVHEVYKMLIRFTDVEHNETEYRNPGLTNNFTLVNAYTWEGGRGYRCDFWRSVAGIVPE
jgi:hypothetical protein